MATMSDLVKAVKVHAGKNYDSDGWDYIVEAFEDEEIADEIRKANARTPEDAIKVLHEHVKLLAEKRADIQSTAF
jgi:hypothetical protein